MTLYDFLMLACDDSYKVNLFDCLIGKEVAKQVEIRDLMREEEYADYLDCDVASWDIDYVTKELCINLDIID